jgi:hypothetical protein
LYIAHRIRKKTETAALYTLRRLKNNESEWFGTQSCTRKRTPGIEVNRETASIAKVSVPIVEGIVELGQGEVVSKALE